MALTRPRASQIYDIDYKQATRVITVSNITLSGGAPNQVDGVNLSLDDRVLVTGQSNQAQNGIYEVDTVGSGSNGTWTRSSDTNVTGELLAGTIVMVTEGLTYADTQWKLVTDDPIVIGTSLLVFEQNSAFAFGNVYANGTAVLASSVGDVLTLASGNNISISGNNTSKTVTIGVTGISLNSISNGTSNVNVVSSDGNVTVSVGGTSNVAVFSASQTTFAGNVLPVANVTYSLGSSTQRWKDLWVSNSTIYLGEYALTTTGNALVFNNQIVITANSTSPVITTGNVTGGNITTAGQVVAMGNITGGNLSGTSIVGTLLTSAQTNITSVGTLGSLSVTGNITGGNILGNGAGLSGINTFSTVAVTGGNSAVADSIADTLTITAGSGISLVMDSGTDTLTIAASGGSDIFVDGADFGTVTETVTASDDLGLVTDTVTAESDLGTIVTSGLIYPDQFVLPSYTVSTLPSASIAGGMIYVSNESGGAVPAFSDGTNWRRVTDRAIVS